MVTMKACKPEKVRRWEYWLYPLLKSRVRSTEEDKGGSGWRTGSQPSSLFCQGKHAAKGIKGRTCLREKEPHFHLNTDWSCTNVSKSLRAKTSRYHMYQWEEMCKNRKESWGWEQKLNWRGGVGGMWRRPVGILSIRRIADNKRYNLTERKNVHGAGCIITDRSEGVCALKYLGKSNWVSYWTHGQKDVSGCRMGVLHSPLQKS